ncbi:EAL domain-containing protein [Kiloniella sp. EL199]|uniref:sensor domain-containing protein n=1 Tax=Kiloniella sp. EL199 TaxID=2107581 RepID=UPI000EA3EA1C|nr:EAL domain-containing protein [Kiloniella sp. EL199]
MAEIMMGWMASSVIAIKQDLNTDIRQILNALPDLALLVRDQKVVFCNTFGCRLLGYDDADHKSVLAVIDIVDADYHDVFDEIWHGLIESGKTDFPLKLVGLNNSQHEIMFYADSVIEAEQDTIILYGKDFSLAKKNAAALVESEMSQRILKDAALSFLCICDDKGISYMNPAGLKLLEGESDEEVLGKVFSEFVHPDYKSVFNQDFSVLSEETQAFPLKLIGLKGSELRVEMFVSRFRHGGRGGYLIEAKDINDLLLRQEELLRIQGGLKRKVAERTQELTQEIKARIEAQETVEHMTYHDALTGLGNRMQFVHCVDQAPVLQNNNESCGSQKHCAVLVMDLDHFKDLNDIFGHETGDQLLRQIAGLLKEELVPGAHLARLGGDEFALMLPIEEKVDAEYCAQRLLMRMGKAFFLSDKEVYSGCSVGIAIAPEHGSTATELLGHAEMALYQAKHKGRSTYTFFDSSLKKNLEESSRIEHLLRAALDKDEFELYYQPQIELQTGRLIGAEALIRWHSSEGMVSPDRFIPIAEKTGLIDPITDWVMTTACTQAREWQSLLPGIRVAINLSAISFRQADFVHKVAEVLEFTQVSPGCLELEITETAIMADFREADRILNSLAELGVHLAIDDFGTGYSSLSYLKRFPVDKLKIDKSFVLKLDQNQDDAAITAAIISMAHAMGTKVLAEGVEEKSHMLFLKERGCEEAQGYFFAKPMPAEDFLRWCTAEGTDRFKNMAS